MTLAKKITKQVNDWCKNAKTKSDDWIDEKHAEIVNQVRYQNLTTYMEICGVDTPDRIDYNNPHVKIMDILADPVNLKWLWNPKTRHKVYELMDEET